MKKITKKVAKGLPIGIRVRKPRYYYQDITDIYNTSTTKNIDLVEFEGLDYENTYSTLTFKNKKLWNNKQYNGSIRALAPLYKDNFIEYGGYSVVGSLTNDNNVFSGFSGNNYLSLNGGFEVENKTWEVVAKFTTTDSFPNLQGIYHFHNAYSYDGRYGFIVRMQGNKFNFTLSSGYSWMLNATGTYTIQPNTTYWVKASFTGSKYVLSYSLDGKYFIEDISYSSTSPLLGGLNIMVAGVWYDGSNYIEPLLGTLDLNECYMKIDNNLAWLPEVTEENQQYTPKYLTINKGFNYTVVGNPTIVDNVVSNFSNGNYIDIPFIDYGTNSWEINLKVTTTAEDLTNESPIISSNTDQRGFRIGTAGTTKGRWEFLVSNGSSWNNTSAHCGSYVVLADTTYWIKAGYDVSSNTYYLKYSLDGIEFINDVSYTSSSKMKSDKEQFGYITIGNSKWHGSIDLNECFMRVNDIKVWGKDAISVTELKGCLDKGLTDNSDETTYNAFVKNSDILLTNKENIEEMFWANKIIVPSHLKTGVYLKNYSQVGSLNIDLDYNVSGFGKGTVIYSPIIKANTTDETLCYVFRVKTGEISSTWRILLGNKGGLNHLVGVGDGKWFLWNVSTHASGGTHESNTPYWVAVMVYPDQTILYYMKDDGTFNDVSKIPLPVIRGGTQSYWSTGPSMNTNMFMNTAKWIGAGNDNSDQYWSGSVDIKNTIVYKNHNNFMANTEIVWQPLITVSESDKLPDKEWM